MSKSADNTNKIECSDTDMPADYGTKSELGLGIAAMENALRTAKSIKLDGCTATYGDDDGIPLVASVDRGGFSTVVLLHNIFWLSTRGNKYTVKWWVDPTHYISGAAVIQVINKESKKDEDKEV